MVAEALLRWLSDATLATSVALLLVLALRRPLRRTFGARLAYAAWALVPLAMLAASLPRPHPGTALSQALLVLWPDVLVGAAVPVAPTGAAGAAGMPFDWPLLLAMAWGAGALLFALRLLRQQHRFVAGLGALHARDDGTWAGDAAHGPAVVGAWRPRIVLPRDFDERYPPPQAALVIAHERAHVRRGDVPATLAASALRCLQWFNPMLHLAADRFRLDQELACDATVLAGHPDARRSYADAMLNTQLAVPGLPVGCHWQSSQSLKERILMLKHPQPGARRRRTGALVLCAVLSASSYAAWALRPVQPAAGLSPPVVQSTPAPPYPAEAVAAKQGGRVTLKLLVAVDGRVKDAVVEASTPAGVFDAAALAAARNWTIQPRIEGGQPVEGWVRVPIDFDPDGEPEPAREGVDHTPPPPYPSAAAAAHQSGRVVLKLLVAADGSVKDVVVEESEPAGVFDAATIEAARAWKLTPRTEDGEAVEGWVRVPVDFEAPPEDKVTGARRSAHDWFRFDPEASEVNDMTCNMLLVEEGAEPPVYCGLSRT